MKKYFTLLVFVFVLGSATFLAASSAFISDPIEGATGTQYQNVETGLYECMGTASNCR